MLTFFETISIYNTFFNEATGFDDYYKTVVNACSWYSKIKAVTGEIGLVYKKVFMVRIPEFAESDKVFATPEQYTDPEKQYTLKAGSFVIKGDGPPAPTDGAQREKMLKGRTDAFIILDWHDNRHIGLKHVYVEGT